MKLAWAPRRNADPVRISVTVGTPAGAVDGAIDASMALGLATVKVRSALVPPPGAPLTTVTL